MRQKTLSKPVALFWRVAEKMPSRFMEWIAGFQILGTGLILLYTTDYFDLSPAYIWMRSYGSDDSWGLLLLILGIGRITGLIINGSMQRVTPWIRAVAAFSGFTIFSMMSVSLVVSWASFNQPLSASLAMYIPSAIAELVAIYFSIRDTKVYNHAANTTSRVGPVHFRSYDSRHYRGSN